MVSTKKHARANLAPVTQIETTEAPTEAFERPCRNAVRVRIDVVGTVGTLILPDCRVKCNFNNCHQEPLLVATFDVPLARSVREDFDELVLGTQSVSCGTINLIATCRRHGDRVPRRVNFLHGVKRSGWY